ncbi:MAG TPA: hypothetical protein VJ276_14555 [Thermoanaerobaculia bacterium]|nr:hypothetical protein [Thermoanaerobaculia bacterium]
MRKLLLILLIALPLTAKVKHKEKRFEPAPVANAAAAAGRYLGPDENHVIELMADGTGSMNGAALSNIVIDRTRFEATAHDGNRVRGTFMRRILNGNAAFGLLMDEPPFDMGDGAVTAAFYRRR